jgi:hypothetical protein
MHAGFWGTAPPRTQFASPNLGVWIKVPAVRAPPGLRAAQIGAVLGRQRTIETL